MSVDVLSPERRTRLGRDLRGFLEFLEAEHPDEILRVREPVDPIYEATAVLWRLERERRWPVVVFENIRGSDIPCVTNVHASFPRLALALGLGLDATPRDFTLAYMEREAHPIPPREVERSAAVADQ